MYCVYDLKDFETCVGIFDTAKDVAKYFKTSVNTIYSAVSRNQKRDCRYEIIYINEVKNGL